MEPLETSDDDADDTRQPETASWMDSLKKWIGFGAAILSALSAVYGAVEYQAEKKARSQETAALLTASDTEQKAHDYPAAWASLKSALAELDKEGMLVRALGGLSKEQAEVYAAQEQLAMTWLRAAGDSIRQKGEGTRVSDAVLPVLATGAAQATGSAKADLLAHIGWAYWLKALDGAEGVHELQFYKDAIALEPTNPYANTFWAIPVVNQTNASKAGVAQAKQLFAAALSSSRATGELRQWIRSEEQDSVSSYVSPGSGYPEAKTFFWQMIVEMHKAGEPINQRARRDMYDLYMGNTISVAAFTENLTAALKYAPAAVHVELLQGLVETQEDKEQQGLLQISLALALEQAGKPDEALATWRAVRSGPAVAEYTSLGKEVDEAIQRLSPGSAPAQAAPVSKSTPVRAKKPAAGKRH